MYSRSGSFREDLMLKDQASGERSQDHWSSDLVLLTCSSTNLKEETLAEWHL